GDRAGARASLARDGIAAAPGPTPETAQAMAAVSARDTLGAVAVMKVAIARHGLDPAAHGLMADLRLARNPQDPEGAIAAYAARVIEPGEPWAWRRWAMVQTQRQRYLEALKSFDRYFALAGAAGERDAEAHRWV